MGRLMILVVDDLALWMDTWDGSWACIFATGGFAVVSFLDDLDKVAKANHRGIPGRCGC